MPGSGTSGLYAGLVGSVKSFAYQGQNYTLWVAKPSSGPAQVKIAQGTNLVTVLAANMLDTRIRADSRAHFAYVLTMAGNVTRATTPRATATATADLMAALTTLEGDITANACVALNQGCFSAGTKLWSPIGYRAIEDFREGEPIYARNEFDPAGPVEVKMVEATFTRNAAILHLHVNGQVVRTTGEHPFFAYDKGWTKAAALVVGDRLLTAAGEWQLVEDVLETGEWETVYNLRVADHHTYFVGDYSWGWAPWAHNLSCPEVNTIVQAVFRDEGLTPNGLNSRQGAGRAANRADWASFAYLVQHMSARINFLYPSRYTAADVQRVAENAAARMIQAAVRPGDPDPRTASFRAQDNETYVPSANPSVPTTLSAIAHRQYTITNAGLGVSNLSPVVANLNNGSWDVGLDSAFGRGRVAGIYILRDSVTGAIYKVGKSQDLVTRFTQYSSDWVAKGRRVQAEIYRLPTTGRSLYEAERVLRARVLQDNWNLDPNTNSSAADGTFNQVCPTGTGGWSAGTVS